MITVICFVLFAILALMDLILLMFYELADTLIRIRRKLKEKRKREYEKVFMDFTDGGDHRRDADTGDTGRDWFEEI